MSKYVAIIGWSEDGRVTKYARFLTREEAETHVVSYGGFVADDPQGDWNEWRVQNDALVFDPPPAPTLVAVVTPRQARLALLAAGLLDAAEAELAKPENRAAQLTWEYALEIRRDDPLIAAIGAALEITDGQIDDLFESAKGL